MSSNENTQLAPRDRFSRFMDHLSPELAKVIPEYLGADRMRTLILAEARREPKIYECYQQSPASVIAAFMLSAELGLEVGNNRGFIYLIPRAMYDKARGAKFMTLTTIIGYRGYAEMARHSDEVVYISAGIAYRDEVESGAFSWHLGSAGLPPNYTHRGTLTPEGATREDKDIVLAYAYAQLKGGGGVLEVLDRTAIEKRHAKSSDSRDSFWGPWYERMARKTAIRSLLNGGLVPLTAPMEKAREWENEQDALATVDVEPPPPPAIEPDPIRSALGMDDDVIDAPSISDDPIAQMQAQVEELEEVLNEAGITDARAASGGIRITLAQLTEYRDELAKRAGGAS